MSGLAIDEECVAVSTRVRLARNFVDYPFPARLVGDKHAEEQSREIVQIVSGALGALDRYDLNEMNTISDEDAAYFVERNLISRDLLRHRKIGAALIDGSRSKAVMINEEDHIREQCFISGFDLRWAYEQLSGIDDLISETIPFAYDEQFGYLTACPTNLGTGLRASVMMFLPAIARRKLMPEVERILKGLGLTVRGSLGEGSGAEGEMFQISNELTLGLAESEILVLVEDAVKTVCKIEMRERECMLVENDVRVKDCVMRSYGVLANCCMIEEKEFERRVADVKLGVALGFFESAYGEEAKRMAEIDELLVESRPANLNRINGAPLSLSEQSVCRANLARKKIQKLLSL